MDTHPRFLRGKRDRALLFLTTEGRCALCGAPLDPAWHADHREAWCITHRTNIHDMQATCPQCNQRKEVERRRRDRGTMASIMDFTKYRPGQYHAHFVIYERISAGEAYTTIVLPTRYGKTDVMRGTALHLVADGLISSALVLSPGIVLRDQVVNEHKWSQFLTRYGVAPPGMPYRSLAARNYTPQVDFTANGERFVSVSMQLVDNYRPFFQRWVQAQCARTGKPVVVYIDEAHTGSQDNSWGATVQGLVQAGALAVLLTATPTRSDGKRIPGFPYEELDAWDTVQYTTRPSENDPTKIFVDKKAAKDRIVRLIAHHTTTFREGWDESVIALVSRWTFDVQLEETNVRGEVEPGLLSMLGRQKTRQILDRLCRDPKVMEAGVMHFVENLRALRRMAPRCAGIIFCGNDRGGEDRVMNAHARDLEHLIHALEPRWDVVIATSADPNDEADTRIKQFADDQAGVGDVLIVKQMAGRGLDVERLKVILDLSPLRAEAAWIQRIMRAATLYGTLPAIYICMDDCESRALFDQLIASQGGNITTREVGALLETYEKERDSRALTGLYVDAIQTADFQDSLGHEGLRDDQPWVRFLVNVVPHLLDDTSQARIASEARRLGFRITSPAVPQGDTTKAADRERAQANAKARLVTNLRLQRQPRTAVVYQDTIKAVWIEAYQQAGVQVGMTLQQIADLDCLKQLNRILAHMEAKERTTHATHRP
jgi:superfamily II DNA or RNA helicase